MKNRTFFRKGALFGAFFACFLCLIFPLRAKAAAVALTFDDGPSGTLTRELLTILKKEDIPATFFLCGYRIAEYPDAAALYADTPHELGVHGYSHDYLDTLSRAACVREISETAHAIEDAAGRAPTLLRPPGGRCNAAVCGIAAEQGYPVVLWSVDPEDWREERSAAEIAAAVCGAACDGDIILLHEIHRHTLDALPEIVAGLRSRGFAFLTVSELAARQGVELAAGEKYTSIAPDSR